MNIRYVISYMDKDGSRCMAYPQQGRNTQGSKTDAEKELRAFLKNNNQDTVISIFGKQSIGTFEVSAIECYDGHNDPKGCFIREELNPGQICTTGWIKEALDKIDLTKDQLCGPCTHLKYNKETRSAYCGKTGYYLPKTLERLTECKKNNLKNIPQ